MSHYLGRLAALAGAYERAAGYFEQAISTCRGLEAPVLQARAEVAWAHALLAAGHAGAGERANTLLESARARAQSFGAHDISRRIDAAVTA